MASIKGNSISALIAYLVEQLKDVKVERGLEGPIQDVISKLGVDTQSLFGLNKQSILEGVKNVFNVKGLTINVHQHYDRCSFVNVPKEYLYWEQHEQHTKALILIGASGLGKTELAMASGKNPLLVSNLEDLKKFNPLIHGKLVYDDFSTKGFNPELKIHLIDLAHRRNISVKHGSVDIPAGTIKIFTSNRSVEELFGDKKGRIPDEIMRRVTIVYVSQDMRPKQLTAEQTTKQTTEEQDVTGSGN